MDAVLSSVYWREGQEGATLFVVNHGGAAGQVVRWTGTCPAAPGGPLVNVTVEVAAGGVVAVRIEAPKTTESGGLGGGGAGGDGATAA